MTPALALDERSRRRPTWRPGRPVALANGQSWHLPFVSATPRVTVAEDGRAVLRLPWGADLFSVLFDLRSALAAGPGREFGIALAKVGIHLLCQNYALSAVEADGLLSENGVAHAAGVAIADHLARAVSLLIRSGKRFPVETN